MSLQYPPAWQKALVVALLAGVLGSGCATTDSDRSAGTVLDDAVITSQVKSAFIADPTVKALAINVDTDDGVVTLTGSVNTQAEIDRAVSLAENRDGVRSVRNNLTLAAR